MTPAPTKVVAMSMVRVNERISDDPIGRELVVLRQPILRPGLWMSSGASRGFDDKLGTKDGRTFWRAPLPDFLDDAIDWGVRQFE